MEPFSLLVGIGLSASFLANENKSCSLCDSYTQSRLSAQPSMSVEARSGELGLMLSYGRARFDSQASAIDPDHVTYKRIEQTIDASWIGLQGTYTHQVGQVGLRLMAGAARVSGHNDEHGTYDQGAGQYAVSHQNDTQEVRPMLGLGIEYALDERWNLKAEYQHIGHVVESTWTLHNTIDAAAFQIVRKW